MYLHLSAFDAAFLKQTGPEAVEIKASLTPTSALAIGSGFLSGRATYEKQAKHCDLLCAKSGVASIQFSVLFSARIRERRPAFCMPETTPWCGRTRFAEGRGYADLRGDREGRKLADPNAG